MDKKDGWVGLDGTVHSDGPPHRKLVGLNDSQVFVLATRLISWMGMALAAMAVYVLTTAKNDIVGAMDKLADATSKNTNAIVSAQTQVNTIDRRVGRLEDAVFPGKRSQVMEP